MKKIIFAVILLIAAVVIYQALNNESSKLTASAPSSNNEVIAEAPVAQPAAEPANPLITEAADNARVFIIEPVNGATVSSPVKVVFGVENTQLAPAGQNLPNSGHHHLLIDQNALPALDAPLPANDNVIHFGKGQTETTIELTPGEHSLQLILGNYLHVPHSSPIISEKVLINVSQ